MREEQLNCLNCASRFDEDDVNATYTGNADRCFVRCAHCGARNEIQARRVGGIDEPPRAVVTRLVED